MRPNRLRLGPTKLLTVLSVAFLLAFAVGTKQLKISWENTALGALRLSGREAFRKAEYRRSAGIAADGYRRATALNHEPARLFFLQLLAVNDLAEFRYADALRFLLKAERSARLLGDQAGWTRVAANLANLYLTLGDYDAAWSKAQEAVSQGGDGPYELELRITLGRIAAWKGNFGRGEAILARAADLAKDAENRLLASFALDELGSLKLARGDLAGADATLSAAFRLHRLENDSNIAYSYLRLSILKLRQRDPAFALRLNDRALENLGRGTLAPFRVWQERGLILEALGRGGEAAASYLRAIELARRWRAGYSSSAQTQTLLADGLQASVYDRFVSLKADLAIKAESKSAAWEAFAALEENRASSLNALASNVTKPTDIYRQCLAALRAVEMRLVHQDSLSLRETADRLRKEIDQIEANTLIPAKRTENFPSRNSLTLFEAGLSDSEALFSFAISRSGCYRWSISRRGFTLQRLGACEQIAELVRSFRQALECKEDATNLGVELYRRLFGQIPAHAAARPHWIVSLDDILWELPLSALVVEERGGLVYLVERHSLQIVPSAFLWDPSARVSANGRLVAFGDPVYNVADARRAVKRNRWQFGPRVSQASSEGAPLNRLVASGAEISMAAKVWRSRQAQESTVISGPDATRERVVKELGQPVAVIHLAAHVLSSRTRKDEAVIAMSMDNNDQPDALTSGDIGRLRVPGSLIVMNGCGSGRGEIHRGAGLLGLTRSWLKAGAGSVISSQWDMPDDAGDMFPAFYRHWTLAESQMRVSEALRRAQVDMLRSSTWRANPGFWAAYSVTGVAQ